MAKQKVTHKLIWLKADGTRRDEEAFAEPSLQAMRKWVGGDIEQLARADYQFIVNEDGRRDGLDQNAIASKMYGSALLGNVLVVHKL